VSFAWFQFHSGSIQTIADADSHSSDNIVSIPLWFDSNLKRVVQQVGSPVCFNSTLVRFKPYLACEEISLQVVSIPLWFDSNSEEEMRKALNVSSFNSTLVRFKQALEEFGENAWACFNSTLVRFKLVGICPCAS